MSRPLLQCEGYRDPGPCPTIETARLRLRPHRLSDAESIARSLSDFDVSRMLARVPAPYDRQDAAEWLGPVVTGRVPGWTLAITTGEDLHIGCVALQPCGAQWHLGYWLARAFWGRGHASEAVHGATARFLARMPGTEIRSGVFADNPASLKVQEKTGFRVTGCGEIFSQARNAMVTRIDTRLSPGDFRPAAPMR